MNSSLGTLRTSVFFLYLLFYSGTVFCQAQESHVQARILILLDASGSMKQQLADSSEKFRTGCEVVMRIVDSIYAINNDAEFSLRVFGQQHPVSENDCHDTRSELPFRKNNKWALAERLKAIHPLGVSPIAYSLKEAAEKDIIDEEFNAYSIILITDGVESCGGDICEVMRSLIRKKVFFKPYIIGLEAEGSLKKEYECMGEYLKITSEKDKTVAVSTIIKALRPSLVLSEADYAKLLPQNPVPPNAICGTLAKSRLFDVQKMGNGRIEFENTRVVKGNNHLIKLANGDTYSGVLNENWMKVKGIYTWANGEKYKGCFKGDKKDGNGTYYWPGGDSFEGEWKDDEPVKGTLYVIMPNENQEADTAVFAGEFTDGKMHGYGETRNRYFHYEGNWDLNKKSGQGKGTWVDGRYYEGAWVGDKRTGHGLYVLANGDRYQGEWKDNQKNGKADVQMANGDKYTGVYRSDMLQGQVMYWYANGDKYEGNYKDDSMSGHGVYTWANGDRYDGEWKKDVKNGHGVFTAKNGERYEGEWKNDAQNGMGTFVWPAGSRYTGLWKDNLRDGFGTCTWVDGSKYIGNWKTGKMNGQGVYTTTQGKKYDGNWEDDVFKGK